MVSNNIPRKISSDQKHDFFFRTIGQSFIFLCIYLIILFCYIIFGRKDNFVENLIFLVPLGILSFGYVVYEYLSYKKNINLAVNGKLIQAQIAHIDVSYQGAQKLTYTYQVNERIYNKTYQFKATELSLFKIGDSIDIFYNLHKPDEACVARYVFSMEYEKATPSKLSWILDLLVGILCVGFSIFEYFHISSLEQKSVDGYIYLSSLEGIAYRMFGKLGVTALFASLGLFFLITAFLVKKELNKLN